jgi:quinol monooxygenase YgiN
MTRGIIGAERSFPRQSTYPLIVLRPLRIIKEAAMLVVHVHVQVKPEFVEAFTAATVENASHSVQEPGIARFDVVQQSDDPTRFVLVEVYRNADAPAAHKETAHYQTWRDTVAEMMAVPRQSVKYANVFPMDAGW